MSFQEILVSTADGVTTIALNRPDRLNAYTPTLANELQTAVQQAGVDPDCRVIVITGEGRGFCAGADMGVLENAVASKGTSESKPNGAAPQGDARFSAAPGPALGDVYAGRFGYLYSCPKPVIAKINGPCAGIGLILALYCDLRYAAEEAKFTTAFAARGLVAEHGIAWLLPRLVGEAAALDLLFTARKFTGTEAQGLGLVNRAVPGDKLDALVDGVAQSMAKEASPRSIAVMKRQVRASYFQSFGESLAIADAEMKKSFEAPDFGEGVKSFMERRPPAFPAV
ncbi:MAG: enoyl-CoA hydratase [Albimonas sp.]|uniref:enoyl-CoA hydratase n=1 Tax=Albimonas sp. TaxID=1872425 RepID=UPI004056625C|tara:strand:+ start:710 stop:1558 length:849 start_codon:yes stop_codon:yes gene_type:complete